MPWFRRVVCLLPLLALIVFCNSCSGFFVSESSTQSIAVSPTSVILKAAATAGTTGDTYALTVSATTVGGTTTDETAAATWTSSAPTVVTVSGGNLSVVTAAANSTAVITATFGGQTSTANVLTYTGSAPSGIVVNLPTGIVPASIAPGQSFQVTATAPLSGNSTANISSYVSWSSNTPSIATVDVNGNVSVLSTATPGATFTIMATANLAGATATGTSTTFTIV